MVLAWTLWILGVGVVALDLFVHSADDIGHVGIVLALGGGILYIRALIEGMGDREANAYRLGRDSVRSVR